MKTSKCDEFVAKVKGDTDQTVVEDVVTLIVMIALICVFYMIGVLIS